MIKNSGIDASLVKDLTARLSKVEKKVSLLTEEISQIKNLLAVHQSSSSSSVCSYSTKRPADDSEDDDDMITNVLNKRFHEYKTEETYNTKETYNFDTVNDHVVIYTDGACENNGKPNAKAGIGVWFGHNHPLNVSKPVVGRATNNTAELQACICALKVAYQQGVRKAKIMTDSQFVINCMTQWIFKWKKNNWRVASGAEVKNKEDIINLDKALSKFDHVIWEHVEGHAGILGNEQADRLARAGATKYVK